MNVALRTLARPVARRLTAPASRSLATYYAQSHEYINVSHMNTNGIAQQRTPPTSQKDSLEAEDS